MTDDGQPGSGRSAGAGLLPVIHEGCGHQTCLIVTGDDVGRVI